MRGKAVVVTGSSRGIGRETALRLGLLGAGVVINGRDTAVLERSRDYLLQHGVDVNVCQGDVTNPEDCRRLVETCVTRYGRLDVLVNNAGVSMRGTFSDLVPEVVDRVLTTNIAGAVLPSVAAMSELRRSGGSIVFISSLAALRGFPGVSIYSAAKMSLTAIAQSLEAELYGSGVHVGIVYLGFTENDPEKRSLSSDGSEISVRRRAHMTQAQAAERIVSLVLRRKRTSVLTIEGRLLGLLQRMFPRLVQFVMNRSGGKIHLEANHDRP